ncbi:hypothetical protein TRFO_01631 [Tritrichomonas foetus]|uniref:Uncharacterized protein n=1 Tax=Tritrichomonas foetus TaxID=1144522 RepID=A0A1J4JU74_9EUKA|nr:hypothetical protein TRFO_01631 [Tritrichomonas foetus]|eukprot:OHT01068.1 hypothetical protein TRFO_01631 [Tritrichomonas foetus]
MDPKISPKEKIKSPDEADNKVQNKNIRARKVEGNDVSINDSSTNVKEENKNGMTLVSYEYVSKNSTNVNQQKYNELSGEADNQPSSEIQNSNEDASNEDSDPTEIKKDERVKESINSNKQVKKQNIVINDDEDSTEVFLEIGSPQTNAIPIDSKVTPKRRHRYSSNKAPLEISPIADNFSEKGSIYHNYPNNSNSNMNNSNASFNESSSLPPLRLNTNFFSNHNPNYYNSNNSNNYNQFSNHNKRASSRTISVSSKASLPMHHAYFDTFVNQISNNIDDDDPRKTHSLVQKVDTMRQKFLTSPADDVGDIPLMPADFNQQESVLMMQSEAMNDEEQAPLSFSSLMSMIHVNNLIGKRPGESRAVSRVSARLIASKTNATNNADSSANLSSKKDSNQGKSKSKQFIKPRSTQVRFF